MDQLPPASQITLQVLAPFQAIFYGYSAEVGDRFSVWAQNLARIAGAWELLSPEERDRFGVLAQQSLHNILLDFCLAAAQKAKHLPAGLDGGKN